MLEADCLAFILPLVSSVSPQFGLLTPCYAPSLVFRSETPQSYFVDKHTANRFTRPMLGRL